MDQASIIGMIWRSPIPSAWCEGDDGRRIPQKVEPRESARPREGRPAWWQWIAGLERAPLGPRAEKLGRDVQAAIDRREAASSVRRTIGRRGGDHRAAQRPTMSFVAVKTEEQQARGMLPYGDPVRPADANDQRAAGPFAGVWRIGACSCRRVEPRPLRIRARGYRSRSGAGRPLLEQIALDEKAPARIGEGCARPAPARTAVRLTIPGVMANHCDGAAGLRTAADDGELSAGATVHGRGSFQAAHAGGKLGKIAGWASATSGGF